MLRSLKDIKKCSIGATDGDIGQVRDLYFDDHAWAARYLIVNTSNWWLGHEVLIAPQWVGGVHWSDETVSVDLSREAVKSAPDYASSADLDRRRESGLYAHCGRPSYRKAGSTLERDI
ncbi:MAG: hypothetical protein H7337_01715 [Rhizobacter sp.]|nr:hypothetical protein [Rhizobacter sp.]